MNCPVDGAVLVMSERSGIEIDYCPTCRGVWLDRGELDKIIDRASGAGPALAAPPDPYDTRSRGDDHSRGSHGSTGKRRKRDSWFGELFD